MSLSSLNLLFLVPRLDVGGVQRQVCLLSGGLRAAGHRVLVATLVPGGMFRAELLARGIPTICLGGGEHPSPRLLKRLLALIDRERPDLVYSFLPSANLLAGVAKAIRPETPVVWGLRLTGGDSRRYGRLHRVTYWLERHWPSTIDLMIANAPSVRETAIAAGLRTSRIIVVPNGFDAGAFRPDPEGRKRIREAWEIDRGERLVGLVGRIDPMKGHEVFLEAARRLAAEDSTLRFVCVGPDPYGLRTDLEALARRLGLSQRLSWRGTELGMRDIYSALDVLCHASIFGEGFPNVLAEAMLCEVLCVATDIGHSRDLVRGVGALVPPGDAGALAAACRAILRLDGPDGAEARRRGRERIAEEFSVERLVSRTVAALGTLPSVAGRSNVRPGKAVGPGPDLPVPGSGNSSGCHDPLLGPERDALPGSSIVVYTAITGRYDSLKEQPASARDGVDFVAFLDEPRRSRTWKWRAIHAESADPALNAKIHKVLPHKYFPEARYSLWIDGSVRIRFSCSIRRLIRLYLADCDLVVFRHWQRTCIYQEAGVCLRRRLDDPEVVWDQICRYSREGYPPNAGLAECTVILRRHTPVVNAFNEAWWDEITRGSRRDQLSFPYVARKVGLRYGTFPGTLHHNPLFQRGRHVTPPLTVVSCFSEAALDRLLSGLHAIGGATLISFLLRSGRESGQVPSWRRRCVAALVSGSGTNMMRRVSLTERLGRRFSPAPGVSATRPAGGRSDGSATGGTRKQLSTAGRSRGRRVIALGPMRDVPSWDWVGFDTARELSKYYDIVVYDSWLMTPACDALFIIKQRPPARFLAEAERSHQKIVYCPVDIYSDSEQLALDAHMLRACTMVLLHSERLLPLVRPYCSNAHFVEHHSRYALNTMADYKEGGFILWIGGYQYVPYLLKWLESHPIGHELKILTDVDKYWSRDRARLVAAEIGATRRPSRHATSIAGYPLYPWSERLQHEMMRDCKAAFDIKWTQNFNQNYKPPTKAQQFIASGIPFAVNSESYSAEYCRLRGFEVASPLDTARWFSREYWEATLDYGKKLRASTSLQAVGSRYRELIETLWTDIR